MMKSKKDTLRKTTNNLVCNNHKINEAGDISETTSGVTTKPHRFYGGSFWNIFNKGARNAYGLACFQKKHIEKYYNFLKCRIVNNTLICCGYFQPENCDRYKVRIKFLAGRIPEVMILSPDILPLEDIHRYKGGSLCLFYPLDMKWKDTTKISEFTIPWIFEWILYYEIWKLTGLWEGAEKLHA